jgi:hypothetical protein
VAPSFGIGINDASFVDNDILIDILSFDLIYIVSELTFEISIVIVLLSGLSVNAASVYALVAVLDILIVLISPVYFRVISSSVMIELPSSYT